MPWATVSARTIVLKAQIRKVVDWWRVHDLPWLAQERIKQGEPPLKADPCPVFYPGSIPMQGCFPVFDWGS